MPSSWRLRKPRGPQGPSGSLGLPIQTGYSGSYLSTDGSASLWVSAPVGVSWSSIVTAASGANSPLGMNGQDITGLDALYGVGDLWLEALDGSHMIGLGMSGASQIWIGDGDSSHPLYLSNPLGANLLFGNDQNYEIGLRATTDVNGKNLTIYAGPAAGTGSVDGGNLYLRGGSGQNGGVNGQVLIGDSNTLSIVLLNGPTINASGNITNVTDPVNNQDAATKKWVTDNFGGGGWSGYTILATVTASMTASAWDFVPFDPSAGGITASLPNPAGNSGKQVIFKNITTSTVSLLVTGSAPETPYTMNIGYEGSTWTCNGTYWYAV